MLNSRSAQRLYSLFSLGLSFGLAVTPLAVQAQTQISFPKGSECGGYGGKDTQLVLNLAKDQWLSVQNTGDVPLNVTLKRGNFSQALVVGSQITKIKPGDFAASERMKKAGEYSLEIKLLQKPMKVTGYRLFICAQYSD